MISLFLVATLTLPPPPALDVKLLQQDVRASLTTQLAAISKTNKHALQLAYKKQLDHFLYARINELKKGNKEGHASD
jgi:hypothetical protein